MDEEQIIRRMVGELRRHPGEWLTFRRLAWLVAMDGCDGDVLAAIAEFRFDLFAMNQDRRLKLRDGVVETIGRLGIANWQVPPRPERPHTEGSRDRIGRESEMPANGCYCGVVDEDILRDLREGTVPEEALVSACCWRNICRVRGLYFNLVAAETWEEICRRRGYLLYREDSRGF